MTHLTNKTQPLIIKTISLKISVIKILPAKIYTVIWYNPPPSHGVNDVHTQLPGVVGGQQGWLVNQPQTGNTLLTQTGNSWPPHLVRISVEQVSCDPPSPIAYLSSDGEELQIEQTRADSSLWITVIRYESQRCIMYAYCL